MEAKMTRDEIKEWWENKPDVDILLKRPIFGYWVEATDYLLSECERLEARVKELEDNIPDPEWCCEKHKAGLVARIKELEEGIEKHRKIKTTRDMTFWEGDEILYKLIEKENKDG